MRTWYDRYRFFGCGTSGGARALALAIAALLLAGTTARAQSITQGQWARRMVLALGLEDGAVPAGATDSDYIEFLSGDSLPPVRIEGGAVKPIPAGARVGPAASDPRLRVLHVGGGEVTATYLVRVPACGVYALRIAGQGGPQRWRIDDGQEVTSSPGDPSGPVLVPAATAPVPAVPEPKLVGFFVLTRGDHAVSVAIPPGGLLAAFELVRQPFPHVRPREGWAPGETSRSA
jgi:hypothetical protein